MDELYGKLSEAIKHLHVLHRVFADPANFDQAYDHETYRQNIEQLEEILAGLGFVKELYGQAGRQMILADLIEYVFLGRGYYSVNSKKDKETFIRAILRFVNLLMCYETITASTNLRNRFLESLAQEIHEVETEPSYNKLKAYQGVDGGNFQWVCHQNSAKR